LKHLEGKDDAERHMSGGLSIADACLMYLHYLQTGATNLYFQKNFGIAHATINKLVAQFTHLVMKMMFCVGLKMNVCRQIFL